jgi:hypothetical protein
MDIAKLFRDIFTSRRRKVPSDDAVPRAGSEPLGFGDTVRVRRAPCTEAVDVAERVGQVYGETTPSVTAPDVIGELLRDYAINVHFRELGRGYWFADQLLEFVDHGPGTTMTIGDTTVVRRADGEWDSASE